MYCFRLFRSFDISLPNLVVYLFQVYHKKYTFNKIWQLRRPIHAASHILGIIKGSDTIIEMFFEEIKKYSCSIWMDTVLHETREIPKVLQVLYCMIFIQNVQTDHCSNRLESEKWPNQLFGGYGFSNHHFYQM